MNFLGRKVTFTLWNPFKYCSQFSSLSHRLINLTAHSNASEQVNKYSQGEILATNKPSLNLTKSSNTSLLNYSQIREYKVKVRLRKRCRHCYFTWRNGRLYVECPENPRHKQHHKESFLKGYDNIPHGYDLKAEKLQQQQLQNQH